TLILIIVLVIMNSLKQDEAQKSPQMILPPEPSAPTEIINDPLFEPVEVLQEGNESMGEQNLNQVAQKIKEESLQNVPTSEPVVQTAIPTKTTMQSAPVPAVSVPAVQKPAPVVQKTYAEPTIAKKPAPKKVQAAPIKQEPKKVVQPKATAPVKTAAAPAPKAAETKAETKTAPVAATANTGTIYYVQVGSFSKEPNKVLIDRLNASGLKYTTQKVGETTKILVGPFQGEKAVQDAMGNIRQNIEAKAFKIKG
ncbi:MAG TPA: SPOR domain-containing protein, partial [Sulfuricurvum sp.]|nr:SPOR domain-containing protein [Sulfuricurvum sp.]